MPRVNEIDLMFRTMFAELAQRSLDGPLQTDFPLEGRFVPVTVKKREYWYFDLPTSEGNKRSYVGPKADHDITRRVESFSKVKNSMKARRKLVTALTREGGMAAPDRLAGDIAESLATVGLFRLRAVLIGSVAFQTYSGILGVKLAAASRMRDDADFGLEFAISDAGADSIPPVLELLRSVDPSFHTAPQQNDDARVTAFVNATDYRVEFLTGDKEHDRDAAQTSPKPAIGVASAENARFLDFLIDEPIRTVLLHKSGIVVNVPAPERYAVHKLIVASRRGSDPAEILKRDKDVGQASLLVKAMARTRRQGDLAMAYSEAWERGPSWQEAIRAGTGMMDKKAYPLLTAALTEGLREMGLDPADLL
jgi:hypothetical protein